MFLPKSISSLLNISGRVGQLTVAVIIGAIVALCVPLLSLIVGEVINCLIAGQVSDEVPPTAMPQPIIDLPLNPALWLPTTLSLLGRVTALLLIGLLILFGNAALMLVFYRVIQHAAVKFEVSLVSKLRVHALRLATVRTLSAQQTALTDSLDYHVPRVRSALTKWWRTFPRHAVQLVACIVVALIIQPLLALLTAIASVLVVLVYHQVDRLRRNALPVIRERAAQERSELISLAVHGPLLSSVHADEEVVARFSEQLAHYERDAVRSLSSSAWKTPTVIAAASTLGALFLFGVSVQTLRSESGFTVAGAFTFSLCYAAAILSGVRLQRARRYIKTVETAADELDRFLALQVDNRNGDDLKSISRVSQHAVFDHVTVQDSSGRKLLENVSVDFRPGLLVGVVSTDRLQARALVELLMGLGRPVGGRLLFDDHLVTDINPDTLGRCSHWVASDGSLVTGTVRENLLQSGTASESDLSDVLRKTQLVESVNELPDGLATLITPDDDRLRGDTSFRMGLARASLAKPSIVVVEEPLGGLDHDAEQSTLSAVRSLVSSETITVVVPQRLLTLRQCDLVVMLHEHTVADTGSHADLLQRNELYRHLNYLRFNPFRHVAD